MLGHDTLLVLSAVVTVTVMGVAETSVQETEVLDRVFKTGQLSEMVARSVASKGRVPEAGILAVKGLHVWEGGIGSYMDDTNRECEHMSGII